MLEVFHIDIICSSQKASPEISVNYFGIFLKQNVEFVTSECGEQNLYFNIYNAKHISNDSNTVFITQYKL